MSNPWEYWQAALAGNVGNMRENYPEQGYYRSFVGAAVAIWRDAETTYVLLDGEQITDPVTQGRVWISCAKNPVTHDAYQHRIAHGDWPSNLPEIKPQGADSIRTDANATTPAVAEPGPGHNQGSLDDYERMRQEISADEFEARNWITKQAVETKEQADKAQDWAQRLTKTVKDADKLRRAEKEKIEVKLAAIDAKWHAIMRPAREVASMLETAATGWARAEAERRRKIAEEEAKKRWEAEQAEKKRLAEAEAAARKAIIASVTTQHDEDGVIPDDEPPLPLPVAPPKLIVPEQKVMVGTGTQGRRKSASTAAPATATVTEPAVLAAYLCNQGHPDMMRLLQTYADKAIKARVPLPGVHFSWQDEQKGAA